MLQKIILSNCIKIIKSQNPGLDIFSLKERFTFENPLYQRNLALKFSTFGIPMTITLVQEDEEMIALPRGLIGSLLQENPDLIIDDSTIEAPATLGSSNITLRDYQSAALDVMMTYNQGYLAMPCASGKTIIGIQAVIERGQASLVLVHTRDLLEQWRSRIMEFSSIRPGIVSGNQVEVGDVTIATVQSLNRPLPKDFTNRFGLILLDECHHLPAFTFRRLINSFPARFRYGLSATPVRADGLTFMLNAAMGRMLYSIDNKCLIDTGNIIQPMVEVIKTGSYLPDCPTYGCLIDAVINDAERNNLIIRYLVQEVSEGNWCFVLSERIAHLQMLHSLLQAKIPEVKACILTGKTHKEERLQAIEGMNSGAVRVIFSARLGDEALDIKRLNRIFLACPARSINRTIQRVGRALRPFPGKESAVIYDFVDDCIPLAQSQFLTRKTQVYKDWQITELINVLQS